MTKKIREPEFKIGDILRVSMPVMAVNLAANTEEKKFDVEEVYLVGDEGLMVVEVEYVKRSNEYLYSLLTENSLEAKKFSIPEEQLTHF